MATSIHEPPKVEERKPQKRVLGGAGDVGNSGPTNGDLRLVQEHYAPPPSKTAIWVFIAAVAMTFAAFTSALVVRKASALDWRHLVLPRILYFNTLALIASSVTLEVARRRIAIFMTGFKNLDVTVLNKNPGRWLYVTLFLGLIFVVGQYVAWLQLRSEGLFLATNPSSSFFYVLTVIHALHVLGGLYGLTYVIRKLNRVTLRRSTLDSFSYYWHFMGGLWVYLLLLLWLKL